MEKCIDKDTFLAYFKCRRMAYELFNDPAAKEIFSDPQYRYNETKFKIAAIKYLNEFERESGDIFKKNALFTNSEGKSVTIDLLIKSKKSTIMVECIPKYREYIGAEIWWIAYKVFILRECGVKLNAVWLVCLGKDAKGNVISRDSICIEFIMGIINNRIPAIKQKLSYINKVINDKTVQSNEPDRFCLEPKECPLINLCWKNIRSQNTVFDLTEVDSKAKFNLYWQDYFKLDELPVSKLKGADKQRVKSMNEGKPIIEQQKLGRHFENIIDRGDCLIISFEYTKMVIQDINIGPWKAIPYQYTCQYIDYKKLETKIDHKIILPEENIRVFCNDFISKLESRPELSIVVYNKKFITKMFANLSEGFPELKNRLNAILGRTIDIYHCIESLYYYHPRFKGSFGLKNVMKALLESSFTTDNYQVLLSTNSKNEYFKLLERGHESVNSKNRLKEYSQQKAKAIQALIKYFIDLSSDSNLKSAA